jgi:hypothetical protein
VTVHPTVRLPTAHGRVDPGALVERLVDLESLATGPRVDRPESDDSPHAGFDAILEDLPHFPGRGEFSAQFVEPLTPVAPPNCRASRR